jgi:hypothetical protein
MALFSHAQFCAEWVDRYYDYYHHQKFYWTTKKKDNYGNVMHLKRDSSGSIERVPHVFHGKNEQLTEPEIRKEGYNPDYYLREEVE